MQAKKKYAKLYSNAKFQKKKNATFYNILAAELNDAFSVIGHGEMLLIINVLSRASPRDRGPFLKEKK